MWLKKLLLMHDDATETKFPYATSHDTHVKSYHLIVELVVAPGLAAPEVLDHEREEADCVDDEDEDDVLVRVGAVVVVAAPTPQQPHLRQERSQVGAQLHDGAEKSCC